MAIFNSSNSTATSGKTDSNTTIITAGAKIKGEITLSCNLYIDGELEGRIDSSKEVNVGKSGHVNGNISADRLIVQGYIEGSVEANHVEIKSGGRMNGEVNAQELIIEAKGIFEGSSVVKDSQKNLLGKTKEA
jgi:cytoskeletal protein CcmA (bactofilin family)